MPRFYPKGFVRGNPRPKFLGHCVTIDSLASLQRLNVYDVCKRSLEENCPMRWILGSIALLASTGALLAQGKGIRLWNLTTSTITGFQLSPAGQNAWGPNQTLNDKDKEVDHD